MTGLLADPNLQWVLGGSLLLGVSSGTVGSFALMRGRSLLGDVLAHAALPGICLAFILTGSKALLPLLIGAAIAGLIATWCIDVITRYSRIKEDTALGIVLTVFFGFGVVLLTYIQHSGAGNQAGLDAFLFGQAAALVGHDVLVLSIVSAVLLLTSALFFKEFKLICFDASFAQGLGFPVRVLEALLMTLIVVAVVVGLQAVGVILMAALLITPAVAARYWTERLGVMVVLAGFFGGISGVVGSMVSALGPRLPTGPLIVLSATVVFLISLIGAPQRGLVAKALRRRRLRHTLLQENLLQGIYQAYERRLNQPTEADQRLLSEGVPWDAIVSELSMVDSDANQALRRLQLRGLVRRSITGEDDRYELTPSGLEAAWKVVRLRRVYEMYLMHEAEIAAPELVHDSDDLQNRLTGDVLATLEQRLAAHGRNPKLLPLHYKGATNPAQEPEVKGQ